MTLSAHAHFELGDICPDTTRCTNYQALGCTRSTQPPTCPRVRLWFEAVAGTLRVPGTRVLHSSVSKAGCDLVSTPRSLLAWVFDRSDDLPCHRERARVHQTASARVRWRTKKKKVPSPTQQLLVGYNARVGSLKTVFSCVTFWMTASCILDPDFLNKASERRQTGCIGSTRRSGRTCAVHLSTHRPMRSRHASVRSLHDRFSLPIA